MASASILVVEPSAGLRRLLSLALLDQGFRVTAVESTAAAVPLLAATVFDVVVTETDLPPLDGQGLLEIIKTSYRGLKVVIMSTQRTRKEHWQLRGALEALFKPFGSREFLITLNLALKERRSTIRFKSREVFCRIKSDPAGEEREGILNNISFDGALINVPAGFREKDPVTIFFTDPATNREIGTARGTIMRREEKSREVRVRIGVYFDLQDQCRLEFLDELAALQENAKPSWRI
jgi:CheY-like chemotaxis protein